MSQILTGLDDSAVDTSANDMILAKDIADTPEQPLPGPPLGGQRGRQRGLVNIHNLLLSVPVGYRLKQVDLFAASDFKHRGKIAGAISWRCATACPRMSTRDWHVAKAEVPADALAST